MRDIQVKVGPVELQVRDYDHPGDAIIFLHFSGANLMMWQRALPFFQDQYRLVLVDLRGHGKSSLPESGYHIDEITRDVIGIMQQLKIERAHIVGSSLGAEVGLSLAANAPERVISLVCEGAPTSEYGPYSTWEGSEAEFQQHAAQQVEEIRSAPDTIYPSVDALVDRRREIFEKYGWWNEYFEALERYGAREIDEGKYVRSFRRHALADYMGHYFACRFEDYFRKVKCPLLLVTGEESDNEKEKEVVEGLRALTSQGKAVSIKGWDHPFGWLLNPEEVCPLILNFLRSTAH